MKVSRQENPKIAAAGANIELRNRPTRAMLGMTGMVSANVEAVVRDCGEKGYRSTSNNSCI